MRRKEVKIQVEIDKIENGESIEKNQWKEKLVLWKINKIDKAITRLIKKNREKTQITKIRNESEIFCWFHKNEKHYKRTLWIIVCRQMGWVRTLILYHLYN